MVAYIQKSKTDNWSTPNSLLTEICGSRDFYDPCPAGGGEDFDGLSVDWPRKPTLVFCNPPYSALRKWTLKCKQEHAKGSEIKLLMPARVSTNYFHENVLGHATIEFVKGKRKFISQSTGLPADQCCPFDLIVAHYR